MLSSYLEVPVRVAFGKRYIRTYEECLRCSDKNGTRGDKMAILRANIFVQTRQFFPYRFPNMEPANVSN